MYVMKSDSSFIKLNKGQKNLIIAFSGWTQSTSQDTTDGFEWYNSVSSLSFVDSLFVKDDKRQAFLNGVEGMGKNVEELIEFFRKQMHGYEKVIFIGTCGISPAALLYASLLNAHATLSYIPQIDLELLLEQGFKQILRVKESNTDAYEKYKDVRKFLNKTTKYYCNPIGSSMSDRLHSNEQYNLINHLPNVYHIHENIRQTIKTGMFSELIIKILEIIPMVEKENIDNM